jgi:hypothetical protein
MLNSLIKYWLSFKFLYLILGGLFFYLLSAIIDPVFIPTLSMPQFRCNQWVEKRTGYQTEKICVDFVSRLDELKYHHNRRMEKRHHHKMIGLFVSASALTFFLMILNPSIFFGQAIAIESNSGAIAIAVFYGIILGFLMPTIYQLLMPPPMEWLPKEFLEIHRARTELILKELVKLSN